MRRLLIVADSLSGGVGSVTVAHASHFEQRGWEVLVAGPQSRRLTDSIHSVGVATPPSARDIVGLVRSARRLRRVAAEFNPEVVHSHGLRSLAICKLAALNAFVTLHGQGPASEERRGYTALRRCFRQAAPFISRGAFTVIPEVSSRWRFLPHASPRLAELSVRHFPTSGDPVFVWIGRLDPPKRIDIFLRALAAAQDRVALRAVIAGTGTLEGAARTLASSLAVRAEFLGETSEIQEILNEAWAFALFSDSEGLPFALEEAMWAGCAVVSSRLAGPRWLIGTCGFLADSVEEAADAFVRLANPEIAAEYGRQAASSARSRLTPGMPWSALEQAYETA